ISSSQDSALQRKVVGAALAARVLRPLDQVAGAVPQKGRARSSQICQHQLALASRRDGLTVTRIDDLGNVSGFDNVQHVRPLRASVADRTGLRHAVMIHHARAGPKFLQIGSGGRDAAARFPGGNDPSYLRGGKIDFLLGRNLSQSDGVSGSRAQYRRTGIDDGAQSPSAPHAASRYRPAAHAGCRFECCPESQKWPEGEGEENGVLRRYLGNAIHLRPIVEHPIPTFGRIQPAHRLAGRTARLAEARVTLQGPSQVRTKGGMVLLILDEFLFASKGHTLKTLLEAGEVRMAPGGAELMVLKTLIGQQRSNK